MDTLQETWSRREQFDSDADVPPVILSAGVGFAAHVTLFDPEEATADRAETLDAIDPHHDQLSPAAAALYTYLTGDEPDTIPADLRETLDIEVDDTALLDLALDELETLAYAKLLEILLDRDSEDGTA